MTREQLEQIAHSAYETWDTYGGRALGSWHATANNYTKDAWVEVVRNIASTLSTMRSEEIRAIAEFE